MRLQSLIRPRRSCWTRPRNLVARTTRNLVTVGVLCLCPAAMAFSADTGTSQTPNGLDDNAVVAFIDARLRDDWAANDLRPAERADDGEWCRRAFLDLLGRIPTVDELDAYLARRERGKRAKLVDQLLGPTYRDEYVRNWTTIWTNLLIGRTGGAGPRSLTSRTGMEAYLGASFVANKHFDRLVRELVTATGDAQPGSDKFNGAVNFLIDKMGDGGVQATAKSAQLFLGMSVQCTQCHNHPFHPDYRQNQFWELNAFFRQAKVSRADDLSQQMQRSGRLADADFAGEGKSGGDKRREIFLEMRDGQLVDRDRSELEAAPIFYELRNGQVAAAFPAFVDGTRLVDVMNERGSPLGDSGRLAAVDRRAELAKFIEKSPQLELAAVNRMWQHFFGYGFTNPVDDMGPHNPAGHPELLTELATQFRLSGFDMRRLMRWIVLSEAYSLSSRVTERNDRDDPAAGGRPQFSRFYVRQMEPEQLYESLLAATEADAGLQGFDREALKLQWLAQMNTALGNDEGAESTTFNGSIPQALMMMNGELVRRACATDAGGFLARVATAPGRSDREKFQYLYRAALARAPGKDEARVCDELLAAHNGNVVETLQDVWWAVLNSAEFILVH